MVEEFTCGASSRVSMPPGITRALGDSSSSYRKGAGGFSPWPEWSGMEHTDKESMLVKTGTDTASREGLLPLGRATSEAFPPRREMVN